MRSGASAGATAVQPAALSDYATTSAMNTALAGKQDVINDLSDIRAGAAKGETAVQPADLPSSDELVPSSTSVDAGKVLTVDSNGDAGWQTPSSVTVDQTYDASSTNAQSGVAVAQAIASVQSPVVTENGSFKLGGSVPVKVNYTGTPGYDRGPLRLVNTFRSGNYAVAMFEVVGSHNLYYETFGSATLTINEAMYIADTGTSTLKISLSDSASQFNESRYFYRDSFTRTDGKIVPQNINFWNATPYDTCTYIGVGIIPQYGPDADEKIEEVLQQLANGAVSITNWPVEEVMVTTVPDIPAATSSDADKVLTVNSTGKPVWAAAPGGSAITYLNGTESAKDIMDMLDAGAFPVYKETVPNDHDDGTDYLYYIVTKTHAYVDDQSMPAYSLMLTCLYPSLDPESSNPGYNARILGYRVVGHSWTKTNVQVL
jgi:hypothetical protein